MDITIPADIITIVSFVVGIAGFALAIWQSFRAQRTRDMYRLLCESRCKSVVESVRLLSGPVTLLCELKDQHLDAMMFDNIPQPKSSRVLRKMSDEIHAIHVSKEELVSFCERLNSEHEAEFGCPVYKDIKGVFRGLTYIEEPCPPARLIQIEEANA